MVTEYPVTMLSMGSVALLLVLPAVSLWVWQRWRRPGVVVGRHHIAYVDILRSLIYSIRGARRSDVAALVCFILIVALRRRVAKWIVLVLPKGQILWLGLRRQWARHVIKRRSSWITLGGLLWFMHWRRACCERPVVSCRRTFWNVAIVEKAGFAKHEFRPVFWLTSRHAQTVIAHVLADLAFLVLRPVQWRREAVPTFDGGEIHLDWIVAPRDEFEPYGDGLTIVDDERHGGRIFEAPPETASLAPIVLLMYGIGGTRNDHYMKHMALACRARGWRPVVLTYWRLDWNEWRDMDAAVRRVSETYPLAPLFAVVHSASAYVLVQYLAAAGDSSPIVAAVSIAGCMDFLRAYEFVKHTKNRTYRRVFERGIRRCVRRHHAHDPSIPTSERIQRAAKLTKIKCGADIMYDRHIASLARATHLSPREYEYDDGETDPAFAPLGRAPLAKRLPSMEDFSLTPSSLRRAAPPSLLERTRPHYVTPSRLKLGQVKVPLLLVHARDDPLVSHDDNYDWASAVQNARIITVRTHRGGHCGWHEGLWPLGPSWAVSVATDYISAVLEQTAQTGWLCAVFDTLNRRTSKTSPLASQIAHAAASHDHIMPPPPPESETPLERLSSLLFDDVLDGRSSRANSIVDERESIHVDNQAAYADEDAFDDFDEDDDDDNGVFM
ncbi:hypothetical protein CTAYLR_005459 [Chrysophaeum taylorii]|uniref:Uncharacterized protein n=1 Tax=Chrysophaeum taylorii TaxID=2483200 RepID=A0AAD7UKA2_9STRA|nr:hypothetical protein CTAYLR_005459 [Chrysophaeum taylorii]